MKKIFGLTTATLAVFALASCSNDDFFGGAENGFDENAVTLEASVEPLVIGDATRAYVTTDEQYDWAVGDELRVYDNKLQKFDKFLFQIAGSSKAFVLSNTAVSGTVPQYVDPYVDAADETNNAYALFAGSNVVDGDENAISYAGWKQGGTEGTPVALVKIPETLKYKESALSTNSSEPVYKSVVPLWGRVKAPVTDNAKFSTDLNYLTGVIKVTFENANKLAAADKINEVRVRALKKKTAFTGLAANVQAGILANLKKGIIIDKHQTEPPVDALDGTIGIIKVDGVDNNTYETKKWSEYFELDNSKPLCGWFDAELADNGVLVNTTDPVVDQEKVSKNRGQLTIDVAGQMVKSTSVLFIPVICGTYDVLVVDYNTTGKTDEYKVAGAVKNYEFTKAKVVKTTVSYPNASSIVDGTNTSAISEGIVNAYDGKSAAEVTFNSDADRDLTVMTGADLLNTIYLPQITDKNLTVIIKKKTPGDYGTVLNNNLTIADAAGVTSQGTGKVTFVFEGFQNPTDEKKVIINSKANIILSGDFSPANVVVEPEENCTSLTLGIAGEAADNDFDYGTKTLTVEKGNLTVADVVNTMNVTYDNANGTLETASELKNVTVTNASSATVKASVSAKLSTAKDITIEAGKTDVIANLELEKTVSTITLKGGIINTISETATAAKQYADGAAITLNSEGLSAIKTVALTHEVKWTFNSKLNVPATGAAEYYMTTVDAANADETANIYTAAQLAGVAHITAKDFDLKTNITELTNWQSPNLTKAFRGGKAATNGLTIKGVDAPLFGTVTANISNVDLTVAINKAAAGIGGLAKNTAATAVTVQNVAIAGSIAAQNKVGGVFGSTGEGAVIFGDGATNSTNGVSVNVTFTDNTSYNNTVALINTAGTFGKFIGQAGEGAVTINKECTVGSAAFNKSALHFNYNRLLNGSTGVIEWQYKGNTDLIGYSPAATSLTYGNKVYTNSWADPNNADVNKKVKYDAETKKVTGTVRIINSSKAIGNNEATWTWYTAKDAAFKSKMMSVFNTALSSVADDADWSGLTVEVHNLWEAYAQ